MRASLSWVIILGTYTAPAVGIYVLAENGGNGAPALFCHSLSLIFTVLAPKFLGDTR